MEYIAAWPAEERKVARRGRRWSPSRQCILHAATGAAVLGATGASPCGTASAALSLFLPKPQAPPRTKRRFRLWIAAALVWRFQGNACVLAREERSRNARMVDAAGRGCSV